jgi:hypothetical protein
MMRGASLREVQEFLGHSANSLTTTARYTHLSHEYQLGVVELLDEPPTATSTPTDTTADTGSFARNQREAVQVQ